MGGDSVQDWTGDFVVEEPGTSTLWSDMVEDDGAKAGPGQGQAREDERPKDFTDEFAVVQDPVKAKQDEEAFRETDPHRIAQRQRQIDFGKNTIGYQRMTEAHPVKGRRPKTVPRTPDVHKKCSKRAFDGLVRQWRRRLHAWDLSEGGAEAPADPRLAKMKERSKRPRDARDSTDGGGGDAERCRKAKTAGGATCAEGEDHWNVQKKPAPGASPVKRKEAGVNERSACGIELDFAAEY